MKIIYEELIPGNRTKIFETDKPVIPRVGESVSFEEGVAGKYVERVGYHYCEDGEIEVYIYVK